MENQAMIPTHFKKLSKYSIPIIFAVLTKMIQEGSLKNAT
jgi:hypothetical protein